MVTESQKQVRRLRKQRNESGVAQFHQLGLKAGTSGANTTWGKLNALSHRFPYDSAIARTCGEGAQRIRDLEKALADLLEFNGHVAINSVGDVRLQGKLIKARERATELLRTA
jgi:hypothetical protein